MALCFFGFHTPAAIMAVIPRRGFEGGEVARDYRSFSWHVARSWLMLLLLLLLLRARCVIAELFSLAQATAQWASWASGSASRSSLLGCRDLAVLHRRTRCTTH